MKLHIDDGRTEIHPCNAAKVIWDGLPVLVDGEIEKDAQLHLKATDEGVVLDVVIGDGFVVKTAALEVQDLVDRCH